MKPFLGIDLTTDKKNEQINGTEFLIQEPSSALSDALEASAKKADKTVEKAKLPMLFRIIQYICGVGALIIAAGIFRATSRTDTTLADSYQNAPILFWAVGVCAVIWLILWIYSKQKSKTVMETDESEQTFSNLDGVVDAIYKELSVPNDAKTVDVLSFFYKTEDGSIKVHEKPMQLAQYFNPEFKIFADSENLYLVNLDGKYAFPLSSFKEIHTVKKGTRIIRWNKEEMFNKGIYKEYKLAADKFGCIHCKEHHILEIDHRGETFGIYIPCYELPIFEEFIK
ncbi:MAG: hypothetical protein E7566_05375 [Ruminococcaceae bacterium]|nr:hypothetical protein [Oscillospiraceae bacterium]